MTEATLIIDPDHEDSVHIGMAGELDMDNAVEVEQQILAAISNQSTTVTLDLSGLEYIDSAGLRVLFTLGTRLATLQITVRLLVPTDSPIRRVIEISGVTAAMPVLPG